MATNNTTATLDNLLSTYFVRRALPRLLPRAVLYGFADKTPLPKGEGKTVVWNAWTNFNPVSVSLTEGANPVMSGVSSRKVTATIAQYGRGVQSSDLIEYTSSLDVINGIVDNLADSAGLSLDKVVQTCVFKSTLVANTDARFLSACLSATTSAFRSGSGVLQFGFPVVFGTTAARLSAVSKTAPSVSARMSMYSIKKVVKDLRSKNAMEFADGYFKMVATTDAIADLRTDPDYKAWFQYNTSKPATDGQIVDPIEGCRVYASNNLPKHRATGHNIDASFIFGQGAYGVVDIGGGGKGFEIIIKRPGPGDTSNPANMFGTITYKFAMACAVLNLSAGRILFTHAKP
jgi:N4-gp56 family major capsid protein